MPIYEYECKSCGAHVEKMQRISEPPLTTCPECGGELHKLVSLSSFQLKGSGWYVTDYKGKNPGGSNGNGHSPSTGEETETKSEAKSETSKETTADTSEKKSAGSADITS